MDGGQKGSKIGPCSHWTGGQKNLITCQPSFWTTPNTGNNVIVCTVPRWYWEECSCVWKIKFRLSKTSLVQTKLFRWAHVNRNICGFKKNAYIVAVSD